MDEQFPNEDYVKRRKPIQFEDHEDILNIQISTKKLPRNWNVRLVGNDQVKLVLIVFFRNCML